MNMRLNRFLGPTAAALLLCVMFAVSGQAQTHRTKKPVKKPVPAAAATAVPGEAEIVSTADQVDTSTYLSPASTVQQEQPAEDPNAQKVKDLTSRVRKLESTKADPYEERQKRLLLNLDILTRAEQRSETLRKQLFDLMDKENTINSRLDQIEFDSRPDMINRSANFAGSMRPEEIRDARKKSLDAEKANLQTMLSQVQSTRVALSVNLDKSDALVEKLRSKLEVDIDNSFKDDQPDQ
jgi:hypothetical protein